MTVPSWIARGLLGRILSGHDAEDVARLLEGRPPSEQPLPPRVPSANDLTREAIERRRQMLSEQGVDVDHLEDAGANAIPRFWPGTSSAWSVMHCSLWA